jgi:hypothetical protein
MDFSGINQAIANSAQQLAKIQGALGAMHSIQAALCLLYAFPPDA